MHMNQSKGFTKPMPAVSKKEYLLDNPSILTQKDDRIQVRPTSTLGYPEGDFWEDETLPDFHPIQKPDVAETVLDGMTMLAAFLLIVAMGVAWTVPIQ